MRDLKEKGPIFNRNIDDSIRQGSNFKNRSRGRNFNHRRGGYQRTFPFDNTPGIRLRGSAHQMLDRYLTLARSASASGDRILAENYFQHADHYYRLVSSSLEENDVQQSSSPVSTEDDLEEMSDDDFYQEKMEAALKRKST